MSRVHAHRMIEAAEVQKNLLPIGNIPKSESVTRPLSGMNPEQQREVWEEAVKTAPEGKVTAKHNPVRKSRSIKREALRHFLENRSQHKTATIHIDALCFSLFVQGISSGITRRCVIPSASHLYHTRGSWYCCRCRPEAFRQLQCLQGDTQKGEPEDSPLEHGCFLRSVSPFRLSSLRIGNAACVDPA